MGFAVGGATGVPSERGNSGLGDGDPTKGDGGRSGMLDVEARKLGEL